MYLVTRTRGIPLIRKACQRIACAGTGAPLIIFGVTCILAGQVIAGPNTNSSATDACGFTYTHEIVSDVPWSIHIARIRRSHPELELCTTLGKGDILGMATISDQLKALPTGFGIPLAAINGDFFENSPNYQGRPRGIQIHQGELISSPAGHTSFWIDRAAVPHLGIVCSRFRVQWQDGKETPIGLNQEREVQTAVLYTAVVGASTGTRGGTELVLEPTPDSPCLPLRIGQTYRARISSVHRDGNTPLAPNRLVLSLGPKLMAQIPLPKTADTLRIITETTPDLSGVRTAIGGGPALVHAGRTMQWTGIFQMRHPRTALGWNQDYIFLVEVDGRQSELSVGMTFPELAAYMRELGCQEAMNLDGGGSATMWVKGKIVNSPSEGHERPSANALVITSKTPLTAKSF